ncbi:SRPBCC family protein [Chryseobacterium cheonjiense]|uniref:SRPBCC domain-containing protein n=1 Tax=Chryseobacterium cheonjiense TaxID=2728845 RepID=A0A7Y0A7Y0_9FLAO|nr:SRPBCC domain-containing protein [Chryseobacterium cheonjiense]NML58108.1 SRPBCC domain-containing protein [Chryseobacterium cheonjiense]
MKSEIVFNKDADAASVYIMHIYNADVTEVWNYFTKSQFLDQWWAPKPWKCETKTQEFKNGGIWLYSMFGPEGERHYAKVKYGEITEHRSFDGTDSFCDENGNVNPDFPEAKWLFGFTGVEEGTKVTINIHFASEEAMNQLLEMGFEEGFKTGLNQLESILSSIK